MKSLAIVTLLVLFGSTGLAGESDESGAEPKPPAPFPARHHDYQILPRSISPDHQFAFIYPKRSRLYQLPRIRLYLIALQPFRVLSEIPIHGRSLVANAHGYCACDWTADSSAAVFVVGTKWGPDQVWLARLHDRELTKLADLTRAVRRHVTPDYEKSHARRFNEFHDFIFQSDDQWTVTAGGEVTSQRGWDLDGAGHVVIDTVCTTDPKEIEPRRWAVRFEGNWEIASGRFTETTLTRIRRGP